MVGDSVAWAVAKHPEERAVDSKLQRGFLLCLPLGHKGSIQGLHHILSF